MPGDTSIFLADRLVNSGTKQASPSSSRKSGREEEHKLQRGVRMRSNRPSKAPLHDVGFPIRFDVRQKVVQKSAKLARPKSIISFTLASAFVKHGFRYIPKRPSRRCLTWGTLNENLGIKVASASMSGGRSFKNSPNRPDRSLSRPSHVSPG